jgi:hypothetical protein
VKEVNQLSRVDPWFLDKVSNLVETEQLLTRLFDSVENRDQVYPLAQQAVTYGFDKATIKALAGLTSEFEQDLRAMRKWAYSESGNLGQIRQLRVAVGTDRDEAQATERMEALLSSDLEPMSDADFWSKHDLGRPSVALGIGLSGALSTVTDSVYKMVDTCAGEFESTTPYYYAAIGTSDDGSPQG